MANKKKILDDVQKNYIEQNYKSIAIYRIAEYLKINAHLVKVYMEENNLIVPKYRKKKTRTDGYSLSEEAFIKDNYKTMSYREIGERLHKSESAIGMKVSKMNLNLKSGKWTKDELNILKEKYCQYATSYIRKKFLPNRSVDCINQKAVELNIKKESSKRYDKEDLKEMLIWYADKLGRTPVQGDFVGNVYGVPSFGTYCRYFGGYEKACLYAGLISNKCLFGNYSKKSIAKDGISVCLSGNELFITDFLIDNGIKFQKEKLYSDIFGNQELGSKRCDWYLLESDTVVEYFGLANKDYYKVKMDEKIELCNRLDKKLISISERYLTRDVLSEKFKEYINA